ncbi:hypothetical protein P8452_17728 [Trifolium repens]|nr:hypothetical protein P8452_17728 [Trifolium repens]
MVGGDRKNKVFGIAPGGVTPPPCIVVGECAQGEHENFMCRPILPTAPYLDALSQVSWRAGDEKIKVFGIAPGGVTPPPCIVVGECAQGEHENSMCRTILPTAPYLRAKPRVVACGGRKNQSVPNCTRRCHATSLYRGMSVCTRRT